MEKMNDYKSPSAKEIELICNNIICTSPSTGAEGEGGEGDESLE